MQQTCLLIFFFQAEDGIRDGHVTGVQTCALPIWGALCGHDQGAHFVLGDRQLVGGHHGHVRVGARRRGAAGPAGAALGAELARQGRGEGPRRGGAARAGRTGDQPGLREGALRGDGPAELLDRRLLADHIGPDPRRRLLGEGRTGTDVAAVVGELAAGRAGAWWGTGPVGRVALCAHSSSRWEGAGCGSKVGANSSSTSATTSRIWAWISSRDWVPSITAKRSGSAAASSRNSLRTDSWNSRPACSRRSS